MEFGILAVGILAGVLSGMFGIGGGVVMVPVLIAFFGMGMLDANAVSLAAMLLPVGVLGVLNYHKAGLVNIRQSLWIALGLFAGSFVGAEIAISVNIALLSKLYALFLLYIAVQYLNIPALFFRKNRKIKSNPIEAKQSAFWQFILLGLLTGIVAGLFGKGGGIIIVPVLVKLFNYDPKAASATSLAALQLPVGLPSVIVYAHDGHLNWIYAALLAGGIVFGAFFGSKLALNLSGSVFKRTYGIFLVVIAGYMVYKYV